jgi:Cof subfamily protein (haloacid dehalogenase superfamily)
MGMEENIRLIALDLDGTLLADNGEIPEENIKVLREFAWRGVIIVLSSGRMTDCVVPAADIIGIDCPLIVYNGAMVRARVSEGREIIYHNPLPSGHGDDILDYCIENRFHLNYYLNDVLYAQEDKSLEKYALIYSQQTGAKFRFLEDVRKLRGNSPTKLILITDVCSEDEFRTRDFQYEHFLKTLGGKVNLFKTNPEYLEFLNKSADKGVGLKNLAEFYGIKREEIIAFGDGENDIRMLEFAGTGVALANAKEEVKRAADYVAEKDNNAAGVAEFLRL